MTRYTFRRFALGALAAPLLLGLSACGDSGDGGEALSGEPIEEVAPPEGKSWSEIVEKTEFGGYRMGNPEAPIKLVEYASLTCPHCANFALESGEELRGGFVGSGRVSLEFRNFVMNPLDLTMAMLTRCGSPEAYFALTEQTFANQQNIIEKWTEAGQQAVEQAAAQPPEQRYKAIAEVAGLTEFFAARGIAGGQADACLADPQSAEAIVETTADQSEEYDITGTPTFLINGRKVEGNSWKEIKTQLENLGAR